MSKCLFKTFLCFWVMLLCHSFFMAASAQESGKTTVSGVVTDVNKEPLIGVSIVEKGTVNGATTSIDGDFKLQVSPNATLVISYVGYTTQEVPVQGKSVINVVMKEDAVLLDEVVAVGYAVGSKQTISGAVKKIDKKDMNTGVVNSPLNAIQGRIAGVNIQTASSDPTASPSIRIRGTTSLSGGNDPLVVIDGVMGDVKMLDALSPSDIESMTILKDASETAQYGSRGASGVIVVTTQKGKFGSKHLSYDGTFGVQTVAARNHSLTAGQYRQAAQALGVNFIDEGYNTDFMDEILRTGITQNHRISFGKGDEDSNYNVSLGLIDQKGLVETTNKRNYSLKLDVAQSFFNNKLKLEAGMFGSKIETRELYDEKNTFYGAITMNPTYPTTPNEDGTWPRDPNASEVYNPLDLLSTQKKNDVYDVSVHGRATWSILEGLKFSAFGSYSLYDDNATLYLPVKSRPGMLANNGRGERSSARSENYLGNISLSYIKTINRNYINALVLFEGSQYNQRGFGAASSRYSTDYSGADNLMGGAIINYGDVTSYKNSYKLVSFLGRFNYVYDNKYIATVNMRRDGSSKLGTNNKWGFFPSFSLAWNMANESFIKDNLKFVNELKLRASYGISGNQDVISPYNSLQLLGTSASSLITVNGNPAVAYSYLRNANPDLKWETKKTFDVGFDASLFDNRLSLTFDYYSSVTDDLLYTYTVPQPPFIYNQLLANIGSMKNNGVEFSVSYAAIRNKDFDLNISANFAYQQNKVTSLTGTYNGQPLTPSAYVKLSKVVGAGTQANNDVVYMFEGQPLGVFYLPKANGLISTEEGNKYNIQDLTGEGDINVADGQDRYIAGQVMPKYYLGGNISFRYKAFDVQMQLNGAFGHKIYNGTSLTLNNMKNFPTYNVLEGAPEKNIHDGTVSDYWLENGNYLNISALTFGYTFNAFKLKDKMKSLRITASVNNLCTITSYSGLTPMINSNTMASDNTFGVDDKRFYPVARTFSVGLSLNF